VVALNQRDAMRADYVSALGTAGSSGRSGVIAVLSIGASYILQWRSRRENGVLPSCDVKGAAKTPARETKRLEIRDRYKQRNKERRRC
jgi:hypothetical protein